MGGYEQILIIGFLIYWFNLKATPMKVCSKFLCLLSTVILSFSNSLKGQDIHFSQFWNQPSTYNVSDIIGEEDIKFSAAIRDQWLSIPVPYTSRQFGYVHKINPKHKSSWLAFGLNLVDDKAGDIQYSNQSIGLGLNWHIYLYDNLALRVGASLNFVNRFLDESLVKLGNQFDGEQFRQGIDPFDTALQGLANYASYQSGISVIGYSNGKLDWRVSFSGANLNKPYTNKVLESMRPIRWSFSGEKYIMRSEQIDFRTIGLVQAQQSYFELQLGIIGRLKTKTLPSFDLGLSYRTGDALIAFTGVNFQQVAIGFSYDFTVSDLGLANVGRGGPELYLSYSITKVKPLKTKKACCPNY
jgi:type IX secretion system PorP/SprF family membrane protein